MPQSNSKHRLQKQAPMLILTIVVLLVATLSHLDARQPDATSVVGPVKCAECHKVETKIWEGTHHFRTFTELPRREKAREIADKMGLKRIKADSLCLSCHYTSRIEEGKEKAIAGISCESCHGGASGWVKRHSELSGHKTKDEESAAERRQRWADAEAAGMIRPHALYQLAKNCYSCHVVPEENLVNQGGHPAGSKFELVSWSQGEVRHNTWHSADHSNRKASPERKRMMLVVGTAVELEVSLRAVAAGTTKATYAVAMARRAQAARLQMQKIAGLVTVSEIDEIVAASAEVKLKLNNAAELEAAAEQVAAAAQKLAANHDGSGFDALDQLLPAEDAYKGIPVDVPPPPAD
jgi:hypothetical protein